MCSYLYPYQNRVDQNCFFTVGKGMMTGLVPYRDLFEQKGPLLYFLHGLAYLVSPDSFIGVFGLEVASMTLWFGYRYKLARLYTTPRPAMLLVSAAGVLTVVANCFLRGDNAEEFCLPLLTIGLYHLLLFARRNDGRMAPGLLFLNGLLAGCVLWIKYSMLGFWIAWIGMVFLSVWNRRPHREAARALCLFAAGGVAGVGLLLNFDGDKQRFTKSAGQREAAKPKEEAPRKTSLFRPVAEAGPTPFDQQT